jgi:hypothetical protein
MTTVSCHLDFVIINCNKTTEAMHLKMLKFMPYCYVSRPAMQHDTIFAILLSILNIVATTMGTGETKKPVVPSNFWGCLSIKYCWKTTTQYSRISDKQQPITNFSCQLYYSVNVHKYPVLISTWDSKLYKIFLFWDLSTVLNIKCSHFPGSTQSTFWRWWMAGM